MHLSLFILAQITAMIAPWHCFELVLMIMAILKQVEVWAAFCVASCRLSNRPQRTTAHNLVVQVVYITPHNINVCETVSRALHYTQNLRKSPSLTFLPTHDIGLITTVTPSRIQECLRYFTEWMQYKTAHFKHCSQRVPSTTELHMTFL